CKIGKIKLSSSNYYSFGRKKAKAVHGVAVNSAQEGHNAEPEFQVLAAVRSTYNDIVIVDTPESRMLLLDSTHNVHSIFNKGEKWTGSYWDDFASLPAIVPKGPIAIFGLGGGTAAHLMLGIWPSLQLEGWEIDHILIDKAREFLGLADLEKQTPGGGILNVHVGDALSPLTTVPGGYAGIVIDLFSEGRVLPQLQEAGIWLELNDKLMPNGRLMVNCGGTSDGSFSPGISSTDSSWEQNSTIKAMCEAFSRQRILSQARNFISHVFRVDTEASYHFPFALCLALTQLSWKKLPKTEGDNYLAITGPLPELTAWSAALPDRLSSSVRCYPMLFYDQD
ncbi:hypothetical protein RJ639_034588, partial [Escallonia herrerae]